MQESTKLLKINQLQVENIQSEDAPAHPLCVLLIKQDTANLYNLHKHRQTGLQF